LRRPKTGPYLARPDRDHQLRITLAQVKATDLLVPNVDDGLARHLDLRSDLAVEVEPRCLQPGPPSLLTFE
jgi:hypothetical protein